MAVFCKSFVGLRLGAPSCSGKACGHCCQGSCSENGHAVVSSCKNWVAVRAMLSNETRTQRVQGGKKGPLASNHINSSPCRKKPRVLITSVLGPLG